jgi:hypothetical protein
VSRQSGTKLLFGLDWYDNIGVTTRCCGYTGKPTLGEGKGGVYLIVTAKPLEDLEPHSFLGGFAAYLHDDFLYRFSYGRS